MWRWWSKGSFVISLCFLFLCAVPVDVCEATLTDTGTQDWNVRVGIGDSLTGFAFYIVSQEVEPLVPDNLEFTYVQWEDDDPGALGFDGDPGDIADWEWTIEDKQVFFAGTGFTNDSTSAVVFRFRLEFIWDLPIEEKPVYMDQALYNGGQGSNPFVEESWRGTPGEEDWQEDDPYEPGRPNPAPEPMTVLLLGLGGLFLVGTRRR